MQPETKEKIGMAIIAIGLITMLIHYPLGISIIAIGTALLFSIIINLAHLQR